ncbi:MAG: ubiquinol-cytochrome c reductase iron-sulfur subunit [Alphaproteobacteria bacterium]|nr:MAG: ubiquinol-cytochrome c reductase iron-sulfur subunit [Alphaproteobacteria bacterium]
MSSSATTVEQTASGEATRRDFLYIATAGLGAVGAAVALWPFIDQMNPAADTLALSSTEADLSPVAPGQQIVVKWRGKPVFIVNRTKHMIEEARAVPVDSLRDPQSDEERVKPGHENWLIMVGVCTHLGCVPIGPHEGSYDGWFCPCHGSHYDTAGRIRKGPAPKNLAVPDYEFTAPDRVRIG